MGSSSSTPKKIPSFLSSPEGTEEKDKEPHPADTYAMLYSEALGFAEILKKGTNGTSETSVSNSDHDDFNEEKDSRCGSANADVVDRAAVHELLHELHDLADIGNLIRRPPRRVARKPYTECQVCYNEFDEMTDEMPVTMSVCKHTTTCVPCFNKYVELRVKDKDVVPWIPCPAESCSHPIHARDLAANVDLAPLVDLCVHFIEKQLARHPEWVSCKAEQCPYGFVIHNTGTTSSEVCRVCGLKQDVNREKPELDGEFKRMIEEGKMRDCPKCGEYTIKEYGICNVIECAKCGIWWNWRTRDTGTNSRQLKAKARSNGTLWGKGELRYQMDLQRNDPQAFKALLERNGVKYDPNYVRGSGM